MHFNFTDEHLAFREMASEFARNKLAPMADFWDEQGYFPIEILREAAQLGMAGMVVREDIGGAQLSRLDAALIFEQLATGCIPTSAYLSIHNMVASLVDRYGSQEIRKKWGPKLTGMEVIASYCLTEPESGSDAASLKTRAVKEGEYYVLNGAKAFISGGSVSDVYLCMVRTGDESHHGISCLLIEKNTPGLTFGKLEKKLGWRNQPTCMLYFENCRVPIANRVGEEGMGFKIALNALNGGRVNIASCSLGGALACLRMSQSYMHERKQFGKPLTQMQALRFYFADMLTDYEAARLMVYRAAAAMDNDDPNAPMYCAMGKRLATDVAFRISDKAMQLHGGYGYLRDYQIERIFRDLRVHQILEGTNEIMREIIAKASLDEEYFIE
ncbi:TPA: acyl-CoA dehydrogenase [Legionella pneumophila]|uniref:Acyl-CoA dehydrogenase n=1 Tax=Legionella pneumophila TaxID=446 RepID=A0AAN5T1A8_LEGPN|nr:acyl-CoA dehydrogenase family protein [Legionella pneumophila]AEW51160.1 acyl CoA dehydrogenase, short chain specific [Legionella pneumophila subsp. pneumophila ATCC 43290]AGN13774.1 acyl CoA dehydrogenase [Legionella pneumophila subsp. pneumophila str. Thunder Bay]MCK1860987.1 acyl-CoA dehydrogenase family protein [Legionella pneumophila]MCK1870459.1 acyl-CoA dehydrogenase family protein [Legionella pneumophila]MCW8437187.1 acyl-CoA dehydrogenase family protein [Legionella pneumophila]